MQAYSLTDYIQDKMRDPRLFVKSSCPLMQQLGLEQYSQPPANDIVFDLSSYGSKPLSRTPSYVQSLQRTPSYIAPPSYVQSLQRTPSYVQSQQRTPSYAQSLQRTPSYLQPSLSRKPSYTSYTPSMQRTPSYIQSQNSYNASKYNDGVKSLAKLMGVKPSVTPYGLSPCAARALSAQNMSQNLGSIVSKENLAKSLSLKDLSKASKLARRASVSMVRNKEAIDRFFESASPEEVAALARSLDCDGFSDMDQKQDCIRDELYRMFGDDVEQVFEDVELDEFEPKPVGLTGKCEIIYGKRRPDGSYEFKIQCHDSEVVRSIAQQFSFN